MITKKEILDRVLSESEKLAITQFVENEVQREAVKKVILAEIYYCGTLEASQPAEPIRNFTLGLVTEANINKADNEHLGERLRSAHEGIMLLEQGFKQLENFKRVKVDELITKNPAR